MAINHIDGTQSYVGLCVSSYTWYNSSMDVTSYYVNVFNPLTDSLESVYVHNDFDSSVHDTFTIDATDEVTAILKAKEQARTKAQYERQELIEVMTPRVGKTVTIIKGRKYPKGLTGIVFWTGVTKYGPSVGFKDASGTVCWTNPDNLQVV